MPPHTYRSTPVQVTGLGGKTITQAAGGHYHSVALASDGTLWAWGANRYGQLGDDATTDRSTPVQVTGLGGKTITQVATGALHSRVLASDGTVWAWGHNEGGQLGDGTTTDRSTPVQVTGLNGKTITQVASGSYHWVALASDGTAWAGGGNSSGELGDGTLTSRSTPVQVLPLPGPTL